MKENTSTHTNPIIPRKRVDYSRIGSLLVALCADFFGFFGLICAKYGENPVDERIIWFYQLFFTTYDTSVAMRFWDYGGMILILIFIGFFLTYREEISLYGIKYTLYFGPLTIIFSLLWYWINTGDLAQGFGFLFGNIKGYLTFLITFLLLLLGSYLGLKFKQYSLMKRNIIKKTVILTKGD